MSPLHTFRKDRVLTALFAIKIAGASCVFARKIPQRRGHQFFVTRNPKDPDLSPLITHHSPLTHFIRQAPGFRKRPPNRARDQLNTRRRCRNSTITEKKTLQIPQLSIAACVCPFFTRPFSVFCKCSQSESGFMYTPARGMVQTVKHSTQVVAILPV